MDKLTTNDFDENWKKGLDKIANERFFTNTHNPVKTIVSTRKYKK